MNPNPFTPPPKPNEENPNEIKEKPCPKNPMQPKEEQKLPKSDKNLSKLLISQNNGPNNSEKNIFENEDDDLTPRLLNPVIMMKRKKSSEGSEEIPCERLGPIKAPPIFNLQKTWRIKCRMNRSQLLTNNRSTYEINTPSLGSHE